MSLLPITEMEVNTLCDAAHPYFINVILQSTENSIIKVIAALTYSVNMLETNFSANDLSSIDSSSSYASSSELIESSEFDLWDANSEYTGSDDSSLKPEDELDTLFMPRKQQQN